MKKVYINILSTVALSLSLSTLASCGGGAESPSEPASYSATNPQIIELDGDDSPSIPLVGPFTILDAEGNEVELTKNQDGQLADGIESTYDNMYKAIRVAGANSTGKNPLQVQDANYVQIFKRVKKSQTYVFKGHEYVGTAAEVPAKSFCLENDNAYAVNGLGSDYYYLSRDDYREGQTTDEQTLETFSGAYNYMFSTSGDGSKTGFAYATATVRLSETVYAPPTDGGQWNAYIFINLAGGILADLGLIGSFNPGTKTCYWRMVRNCSSTEHPAGTNGIENEAKFYVYNDKTVTESKLYNSETGECSGFDDLHFECFMRTDGWTVNITNLRTGVVYNFEDNHTHGDGSKLIENSNPMYGRALLAASYCPVTAPVWNWDCGAKLTNVLFENVLLTRCLTGDNRDDIEAYRDDSLVREEFYPDSDVFNYGYSQGDFRASFEYGTHEYNGTYKSGAAYTAGSKYIIYNVDYND
ncbi:MAG: hypothetical protein IKB70_09225 [Bacilli bacterium]|nr:hypothetical protein [Bacilli bacterium]